MAHYLLKDMFKAEVKKEEAEASSMCKIAWLRWVSKL